MTATTRLPLALTILALGLGVARPSDLFGDERDRLKVGRQEDGRIVVPTNQVLEPAGKQVLFPGRPVDLALTDMGKTLVVKNLRNLVFLDAATGEVKQTLASPVGFSVVGVVMHENRVLVTDAQNHLRIAAKGADGSWQWVEAIELQKPKDGKASHPAGIARQSKDQVWVTTTRGNSVQLVNLSKCQVEQTVPVGVAPYMVCCPKPDRVYVTNWGGDLPAKGDPAAKSSGTDVRVDPKTGIANHGSVSVLEPAPGQW